MHSMSAAYAFDATASWSASCITASRCLLMDTNTLKDAQACGYTQAALHGLLKEAQYGENAPAYNAYFFKNKDGTKKHPTHDDLDDDIDRCKECGCTIGEHGGVFDAARLPWQAIIENDLAELKDDSGTSLLESLKGKKGLMSKDASDALEAHLGNKSIEGVPVCPRDEAVEALMLHLKERPKTGSRFSLLCNTGPTGSGKSVLTAINMGIARREHGCLPIEIDFNGKQPVHCDLKTWKPETRIMIRILAWLYYPRYAFSEACYRLQELLGEDLKSLGRIADATAFVKKLVRHDGPVFLGIDELKKAAPEHEQLVKLLSACCASMDRTLCEEETEKHIYMSASVYDIVSLSNLETHSKRQLLLQPLPPILPLMFEPSAATELLPPALAVFFNAQKRMEINFSGKKIPTNKSVTPTALHRCAALLRLSAGHPRRIERLVGFAAKFSDEVHDAVRALHARFNDAAAAMNGVLDLKRWGEALANQVVEDGSLDTFGSAPAMITAILKSLVCPISLQTNPEYRMLTLSPAYTLIRIPNGEYCGYMSEPALTAFVGAVIRSGNYSSSPMMEPFRRWHNVIEGVVGRLEHGLAPEQYTRGKDFEISVMCILAARFTAALSDGPLSARDLLEPICRQPPPSKSLSGKMIVKGAVRFEDTVTKFPCAFDEKYTSCETDRSAIEKVLAVGDTESLPADAPHIAFQPTQGGNLCCDIVVVLALAGGGRLALLVQCKEWFKDTVKDTHVLAAWRYGRQFVHADEVFKRKRTPKKEAPTTEEVPKLANAFRSEMENGHGPTHFVHVLVTCNPVGGGAPENFHAAFRDASLHDYNLGSADDNAYAKHLIEDECVMDLEQMRHWCPTAAYSLVSALQLQKVVALCDAGNETDAEKACDAV